jgi:tetratricopeptide (TPR) repeat protein
VPRSAAAYDLFLRANGLARDYDRMSEARDLYQRCVELDPDFAPAWAALGRSWRVLGKYFSVPDGAVQAERAFERAQQLNPDLPTLHNYYAQLECDAGRAVDAMRRLLGQARRSNSAEHFAGLVHACRYTGLLAASLAAHDEARRLDPTIRTSVHNTYMLIGDFERLAREVAADDPELVAMALYRLGRRSEAAAIRRISTADAPPQMKAWDDLMVACFTGAPNAREIAEKTTEFGSWSDPEGLMFHGAILSHLGSTELALKLLRASVDGGFYVPSALLRDPWLDPLRHDARFGEIVALAQARSREALAVFRAEGGERLLGAIADAA